MRSIKYLFGIFLFLPSIASAWQWADLWQSPDQRGSQLLQSGKAQAAAQVFKDKNWQSVSYYRSGNYDQAYKQFSTNKTSDGQYNAGNAAAFMEHYQEAIAAYDKAIALNSNNTDAITNRGIVKKLLQQKQPQQNKQQQNNSTSNNNKNDKDKSSAEKSNPQQSSGQQNQADKQNQQKPANNNQQQSANNTKQNQSENVSQQSGEKQYNSNPQTTASSQQQRQDENNKQLLRRLSDDAGGLLQQKFLRDYARRHGGDENLDQGMN
ncbi:MAG: tetratricopeptide repeat protein [Gammaproteobacteria bacterium]